MATVYWMAKRQGASRKEALSQGIRCLQLIRSSCNWIWGLGNFLEGIQWMLYFPAGKTYFLTDWLEKLIRFVRNKA